MKGKGLMRRRVVLAWLMLGLMLAPALGIVLWLLVVKAPPRNAILISEDGRISASTQQPSLFASPVSSPTQSVALTGPLVTPELIAVYVSGAVKMPGVYTLPAGSRVADALEVAGGLQPEADAGRINLAARILDEEQIAVPVLGAPIMESRPTAKPPPSPSPIRLIGKTNINKATAAELEGLPGIGPVLAARIVQYREANGDFKDVEELTEVPGIKEATLARIREQITTLP